MSRIAVLGGGPGGLYFAYLWKTRHPDDYVELIEQNPEGATFGFGVVFSARAMDFLRADDPETADAITARMETWSDMTLVHRGEITTIDGVGFSAIGRLELLVLLTQRARDAGVVLSFAKTLHSVDELVDFDLVVAADGVNSLVRRSFEGDFQTSISYLDEKFAWFGTTKRFETLTQTFVETEFGTFNAHHYRYSPSMSTFIVECDRPSWLKAGFDHLGPEAMKAKCADIFADVLDGHSLVANKSNWRNFPWIWNDRWSHRNMVLIGDALHTAHYSIGSGTRLALEDVLALIKALEAHPGQIRDALEAYQAQRQPVVGKLVRAARDSASWYADFPRHMALAPMDFAYSYITRSGRVDDERLRAMSSGFMQRYDALRPRPAA
ncbi:monooxygenase [Agrobacterium vitis]|uniref:Monooxygenase n=1 Tax=Agrobacterium vitis TaxID=373 RepID=A0A368P199_AGRVI|nr:FAD-dependent monooxygenase [Agrobacterium vitis]KAA3507405.1 monooxygenase [Agrobacterium vitis]KAA3521070.1 monooxygenase [Agrobacterium vitis]MCF1480469.1 monooxygenase [Agrobacterium vitis]MUZ96869.1 monooxygenase [Agrobacterium vitis]MVA31884.1 monooxygenase [Agrobacterium vitis]